MDSTDRQILALLKENAKQGMKELAQEIGLTVTPTYERVRRLERLGVIQAYTIKLDRKQVGRSLQVMCQVSLKEHKLELLRGFEERVVALPQVAACYHIAGDHDYLMLIEVEDMDAYEDFLRTQLTTIPSIANVQSSFVMREIKG